MDNRRTIHIESASANAGTKHLVLVATPGGVGVRRQVLQQLLEGIPGGRVPRNHSLAGLMKSQCRSKPSVRAGALLRPLPRRIEADFSALRPSWAGPTTAAAPYGSYCCGRLPSPSTLSQGQGSGGGFSSRGGDTMAAQRAAAARKSGIINHAASSTSSGGGSAASGSDVAGGPSSGDVSISSPRFAVSIVSPSARFFCELHAPRYGRASGELKLTH